MFFPLLIFLSAISISLTAAYFSIVGLATMFPGSQEAIIIMGSVLEVGKLIAAVWLHKNWHTAFKFIRNYLLIAVVILTGITSMGIFGFLSRSHVEHGASIEKENAIISQIESKISREQDFIKRKEGEILSLTENKNSSNSNNDSVITRLEDRISKIKEESEVSIERNKELIASYDSRLSELDKILEDSKESGIFASNKKYKELLSSQKDERSKLAERKLDVESNIESLIRQTDESISKTREQIDSINLKKDETLNLNNSSEIDEIRSTIELSYNKIDSLEAEKFEFGSKLRALEVEIGPVKYIAGVLQDWGGMNVDISEAIRIVIVILIVVFDPLAILLLIAATMSYSANKEEELPADVKEIRGKLLEELQEYIDEGGIAEHFIERSNK
tara:strand:- start:2781 stop:3950 length:1170 start_codon:yes stop_codon:yes gene_type:complete